jgi:hypothetical protein
MSQNMGKVQYMAAAGCCAGCCCYAGCSSETRSQELLPCSRALSWMDTGMEGLGPVPSGSASRPRASLINAVDPQTQEMLLKLAGTGHKDDTENISMIVGAAKLRGSRCSVEDAKAWLAAHTAPQRSVASRSSSSPSPSPSSAAAAARGTVLNSGSGGRSLQAEFRLRIGYEGRAVDHEAAQTTTHYDEAFWVIVSEDSPEQPGLAIAVWRLGCTDERVASAGLHGCRAVQCAASDGRPEGAFQLQLAGGAASFYCAPVANQQTVELVSYFCECGAEPAAPVTAACSPPARDDASAGGDDSSPIVSHTSSPSRAFGDPKAVAAYESDSTAHEQHARVQRVEIASTMHTQEGDGEKVTWYVLQCQPAPRVASPGADGGTQGESYLVYKRYSEFDQLRRSVMAADSESESMGVKDVKFPSKTWTIASETTVDLRRVGLQEWLNKILGLNNALVASMHFELDGCIHSFLRPANAPRGLKNIRWSDRRGDAAAAVAPAAAAAATAAVEGGGGGGVGGGGGGVGGGGGGGGGGGRREGRATTSGGAVEPASATGGRSSLDSTSPADTVHPSAMSKDELMDLVEEQRKSLEEKDRQIEELERRVEMAATMARTNCASQIDAVREMAKEQSRQLLMVLGNDGSPAAAAAAVAVKQRGQSKQVFPL